MGSESTSMVGQGSGMEGTIACMAAAYIVDHARDLLRIPLLHDLCQDGAVLQRHLALMVGVVELLRHRAAQVRSVLIKRASAVCCCHAGTAD